MLWGAKDHSCKVDVCETLCAVAKDELGASVVDHEPRTASGSGGSSGVAPGTKTVKRLVLPNGRHNVFYPGDEREAAVDFVISFLGDVL